MTRLPTGVDLCAYRILQEALTNVRRHAPGAAVDVELDVRRRTRCTFASATTGRGPRRPDPDGHGLLGMRERAIMVGGTLTAGPADGGGFVVEAELPDHRSGRMTIRVAVVDDQEIVRAGFAALLGTQADFRVVGTAADGEEAVELCRNERPHVVLMDVRMPVMDGIEATRRVTSDGKRSPRVIVLTTFDLDEYVYDALGAGASGFLLKDVTADTLFDAVRVVAAGDALLAPAVTRRLVERVRAPATDAAQPARRAGRAHARARPRCCGWWPRACRTARSRSASS